MHPDMLLVNAVRHDHPDRARLVEMLLQRGVPLEKEWPRTGQTALHIAVNQADAQVGVFQIPGRLLVESSDQC
jgi:hypothetical protein